MSPTESRTIASVDVWTADIGLRDQFVISKGAVSRAELAFVRARLDDGTVGFGEIAPFAALTGETRGRSVRVARDLARRLVVGRASDLRAIAGALSEAAPGEPAARCGLECAVADAHARALGIPLWRVWGAADVRPRETDITIPILDEGRVDALVASWWARGFRVLKLKVGVDAAADRSRVRRIAERYEEAAFVLDANQAFDAAGALRFVESLGNCAVRVTLFEQPVARGDLEGLARVRRECGVRVVADESVFTLADARSVIDAGAADVINLKIMKSGLSESLAIADLARANGVGLMVGGMVETRLAMSFSLAIALGRGGVDHLDLDTPLLLCDDPHAGGFAYDGPTLSVCHEPGVGVTPVCRPPA